jgi:type II secretory pathway component PulF
MKLAYRACDKSGREFADTIDAPDPGSATEALRKRDLYVIEIAKTGDSAAKRSRAWGGGLTRTRLKELAVFTRQMSVLVSSGTPLVEALAALQQQTKDGPWRETISNTRALVEEGASLSEAMQVHPRYFDPAYRSLIAVGESSGGLSGMLDRLASLKQKQLHIRNLITGALIYPSLLTVMALAVMVLLLTFVVPRFAELFEALDVPLPMSTKLLVVASEVFRSYWWAVTIALLAPVIAGVNWVKTPSGKRSLDTLALRLPRINNMIKSFAMARITRLLGVLLQGRVPVLEALRLTRQAVSNVHYRALIGKAEDMVARGEPIHSAFTDNELVTPSVCETIRNGERSGQVGPLLIHVAEFLDDENEVFVRSLTSIIEPVILVFLGLVVGVVAISLFMPLFDLTSMIRS